jgi:anti-sigma factor ChrR (cupin superfamily)
MSPIPILMAVCRVFKSAIHLRVCLKSRFATRSSENSVGKAGERKHPEARQGYVENVLALPTQPTAVGLSLQTGSKGFRSFCMPVGDRHGGGDASF